MKGETSKQEPLSPELALVDPELAAAARERLPDMPRSYAVRSPSYEFASRFVAEYERAARETGDLEEPRRRPRRRRRRYAALAFMLLAIPVALWAMEGRGNNDVARSSPPAVQAPPPTAAPEPPSVGTQTSKATARARKRPARRQPNPARGANPSRRSGAAVPQPARSAPVLRWAPVGKATFYWFQLYRVGLPGTQKILDAWPARPRLEIPRAWTNAGRRHRLAAGLYRWEVWPQFGSGREVRYTRKIAQGTFRVER